MRKRKLSNYYTRKDFNITFVLLAFIFLGMLLSYFREIPFLMITVQILLSLFVFSLSLNFLFQRLNKVKHYRSNKVYLTLISVVVTPFMLLGIAFCLHETSIVSDESSHGTFTFPLQSENYQKVYRQLNLDDPNILLEFTTGLSNEKIELHKDDLAIKYYALTPNNDQLDKPKPTSAYLEVKKTFKYEVTLDKESFIIPLLSVKTQTVHYTLCIPLQVQSMNE